MQGRKKHILLILLLLLIAFVSMQMMAGQNYTEEKTKITVILPKDSQNELYGCWMEYGTRLMMTM